MNEKLIEKIAIIAYEAVRVYNRVFETQINPPAWDQLPNEYMKESVKNDVQFLLDNDEFDAAALHENWMKFEQNHGWVYGEYYDVSNKTHPNLRPFEYLPDAQQGKYYLFASIVRVPNFQIKKEKSTKWSGLSREQSILAAHGFLSELAEGVTDPDEKAEATELLFKLLSLTMPAAPVNITDEIIKEALDEVPPPLPPEEDPPLEEDIKINVDSSYIEPETVAAPVEVPEPKVTDIYSKSPYPDSPTKEEYKPLAINTEPETEPIPVVPPTFYAKPPKRGKVKLVENKSPNNE